MCVISTSFRLSESGIHREAVIVRSDLHFVRDFVQHRMIRAAMSELQLVGFAAQRQAQNLMAQADAEDRHLPISLRTCAAWYVERLRIARAVRQKHAVRLQRQHIFGRSSGRHHRHAAAHLHQPPQDVALDSEIVGDHVKARLGRRRAPDPKASTARTGWSHS